MKKMFKRYSLSVLTVLLLCSFTEADDSDLTYSDSLTRKFWGTSCTPLFSMSMVINGSCVSTSSCQKYRFWIGIGEPIVKWEVDRPCGPEM